MKILKIFGVVAGIPLFALVLIFAIPGCSSTTTPTATTCSTIPPFPMPIGIVCCVLTYAVLRFVPPFVADEFGYALSPAVARLWGLGGLALVSVQGYRDCRDGGGSEGYLESTLSHDVVDSIGVIFGSSHCPKISAPAQLLTRFFLAGPTRLLKARSIWASSV